MIGASIGGVCAYYVARFLLRDTFKAMWKNNKKFNAIERAIKMNGFKIAFLLRVNPMIPYTMLNYVLAATSISPKDNAKSLIGFAPDALMYVYIGSSF